MLTDINILVVDLTSLPQYPTLVSLYNIHLLLYYQPHPLILAHTLHLPQLPPVPLTLSFITLHHSHTIVETLGLLPRANAPNIS